jgi:hypothetical protein
MSLRHQLDPVQTLLVAVVMQSIRDCQSVGPEPFDRDSKAHEHWSERVREKKSAERWLDNRGYWWICEKTGIPHWEMDALVEALI